MRDIIDYYAGLNYRALDLGIGSDDYKRLFCKDDEPIFDSFIPLTARGRIAATAMSALNRTKRMVKQNPALFDMAKNCAAFCAEASFRRSRARERHLTSIGVPLSALVR